MPEQRWQIAPAVDDEVDDHLITADPVDHPVRLEAGLAKFPDAERQQLGRMGAAVRKEDEGFDDTRDLVEPMARRRDAVVFDKVVVERLDIPLAFR